MTSPENHRSVTLERTGPARFRATNARGGVIEVGRADSTDFTPVELLLAALGGCTGIDVDMLTSRRSEPDSFRIRVEAITLRQQDGNRLGDVSVAFEVTFPPGEGGDQARERLPAAVRRSHDRLCTVGRTIELPTPISTTFLQDGVATPI